LIFLWLLSFYQEKESDIVLLGKQKNRPKGARRSQMNIILFVFPEILFTFNPTNQIFLPLKGVWFLLRRVKRLGSEKPWQPIRQPAGNGAKT
jgi:hypothetical protein